jgi:Transcriptional regulatory protein, C terminal
VLEVGELRLDPARRQAWRGQDRLDLSPKEFALLELFLAHPGEVLTRTRILEQVWDFAYDPASNVVDQYVGYLRASSTAPLVAPTWRPSAGSATGCATQKDPSVPIRLRLTLVVAAATIALVAVGGAARPAGVAGEPGGLHRP